MKTEKELKEWFWDLYNSCYMVSEDFQTDCLCYDENFIRQYKLKTILDEEIIYPTEPSGECLFTIDYQNKWMWIKYNLIWSVIGTEFNYKYREIQDLIKNWLNEHDTLNIFDPYPDYSDVVDESSFTVLKNKLLLSDIIL